jgi:hexokinase
VSRLFRKLQLIAQTLRTPCYADALVRAGKPCRVLALINDSVGVLTASCYMDTATEMGVILGTGTNACIVDKVGLVAALV